MKKRFIQIVFSKLALAGFILLCFGILVMSVRGHAGNPTPTELNTNYWKDDGPLELSPERGRFALIMSVVEDKSFSYSLPIARFTTPDLGYSNGKYVSLFAPGVSFLLMPGYVIGKFFGLSQVGTFLAVSLFALFNAILIRAISIQLGARPLAGTIAGFTYLFATPAFAYAVTLYQHHISTFLILLSIYVLVRFKHIVSLSLIWFLMAMSLPVDYPNVILMAPIGLFALFRVLVPEVTEKQVKLTLKIGGVFTMVFGIIPLIFFLWFNQVSYGNPLQLSGTLPSVKEIDEEGNPTLPREVGTDTNTDFYTDPTQQNKSAVGFFKTRNMLEGLFIHSISPDRGVLYYTPVILLGILGFASLYKRQSGYFQVLLGIIGFNILLYSMWGDPWGGWAFASRYLIPTYAILAIFLSIILTQWQKKNVFLIIFFLLFIYSAGVNTLGAITSNRNPPKVEVLALEAVTGRQEKYTFTRNWDLLNANRSKSYVYQTFFADKYEAVSYYAWLLMTIITAVYLMLILFRVNSVHTKEKTV